MLNPYHQAIDVAEVMRLQMIQFQESLYLEQTVDANSEFPASVDITAQGSFMLLTMTGSYTTKVSDGQQEPAATDDGICRILVQLLDGTNQRPLFDNYIPANLFLSPGRVQSLAGIGEPSDQLYLQFPFVYTFKTKGSILVRIKNEADWENTLRIQFNGIRIYPQSGGN
jgi:hypothetical protein